MEVLVLNRSYLPIGKVDWQEAFSLIFTGRAEIVSEYANKIVHSVSKAFKVPSIIRFLTRASSTFRKRRVKFNRKNVYLRDKGTCQYCRKKVSMAEFTYDHVIPRSQGGKTKWSNIVVACIKCNHHKAARTPEQAKMGLIKKPVFPKAVAGASIGLAWQTSMPESWKDYLGSVSYWTDGIEN